MAKLILSSCDFRNAKSSKVIYDNLPKSIEQCRVLFFPNEKATGEKILSGRYHDRLCEFGFSKDNITVFNYFSPNFNDKDTTDVVYISGGNTFGTMKRLCESGADVIIRSCIDRGAVYIGGSAGAHIASSNIEHVSKYDADTYGLNDYTGLGLFDGILICHYCEERRADRDELAMQNKYRVYTLGDSDSVVIDI